ncbi:MAG: U32 family peptidase, partial [Treponema sp.]|nr:U32 family peptidase [Treponema sp.]
VTVNTVSEERDTERLYRFLSYLNMIGPDGLIVQDFGVVRMCQEFFPNLELHGSTQMNVESAAGVNLLSREGLKRVVVARELGLEEIRSIKSKTSAELEIFVHGALCVSESGLCLFSSFLGGKSANRGMCAQACRRYYTAMSRSGEEQGFYFSPCDLQLIDHIPDLIQAGVESFKIEGRMKSAEYVGSVVAAYRYLMDNWEKDKKGALATAKRLLSTDFARSKTSYWYNFKTNEEGVEKAGSLILNPNQAGGTGIFLGKIAAFEQASDEAKEKAREAAGPDAAPEDYKITMVHLSGGNYDPEIGDSIRLHRQDDSGRVSHKVRTVMIDEKGRRFVDVPLGFKRGDSVYLLQTKAMSKRYPRVLPPDLGKYRKQPGAEVLPVLDITPVAKNELSYFPEGLYIQVSTVSDLCTAISKNPVRVILEYNSETRTDLLERKAKLPVSKKQVIISLDPYCPASKEEQIAADLKLLVDEGFTTFVVNNIAHISMLRGKGANLIGGPYLYTFNRWAASWFENQNIGAFITPLENSWDNLKMTWEESVRSRVLVTAYAYPALFRMRFKLPESYDFLYFKDKEETLFKVNSTPDGSVVMPEAPFSIVDKSEVLNSSGFKRILLDFSRTRVTRQELKMVMNSMIKKQPVPESSRFNWKNGFYSLEKMEIYKAMNEKAEAEKEAGFNRYPAKGKGRPAGRGRGGNGRTPQNGRNRRR